MPFPLRAALWIVFNLAALVAGAALGAVLTPPVNAHNDWGATSMLNSLVGALVGTSSVIVLLMWRSEKRQRGKSGAGREPEI